MHRMNVRLGLTLLALFALVLVSAVLSSSASASGPVPRLRIFHTREWFANHANVNRSQATTASNLQYYGGKVMLTSKTYAIWWAPAGYSFNSTYKSLIARYFGDIGGSAFYNIVHQYYQGTSATPIINNSTFGGQWTDTTAFPRSGTASNPLQDADIQASVTRAVTANGWSAGYGNLYLVFTPQGVESCIDSLDCTPGTSHPVYCAYHGSFVSGSTYLYANMPYAATWGSSCGTVRKSPNGNAAADTEISIISHEHFEAVTDADPPPGGPNPPITAWTDSTGYEIGDKCAYVYGTKARNGSNITLNGHPYIMQLEWSNAVSGCAKSY